MITHHKPYQLPIIYIQSPMELAAHIDDLAHAAYLSIDIEFDRDHYTYGFDLCLLQIATPEACYLIDPKAGAPVEELFPLFESKDIVKIAHCSGEDLRLLHSLQCFPKNIVDTEHYAKILNYERTSLSALLQVFFNVELNKRMQKINWTLRPLTQDQMEYAAMDVMYLADLKKMLEKEAEEKGLLKFIDEENELLSTTIYNNEPKTNFLKPNDIRFLSEYDQYVLNEMFRYRDSLARKHNKPAHHIMSEGLLRTVVQGKPYDAKDLDAVHFSLKTPSGRKAFFQKLDAVKAAGENLELKKKRPGRQSGNGIYPEHINKDWAETQKLKLKEIQKAIAEKYGEHSMRFILSSTMITSLVSKQISIADIRTNFRRKIITDTARQLNIDLHAFN